jgi:hypothetical protein
MQDARHPCFIEQFRYSAFLGSGHYTNGDQLGIKDGSLPSTGASTPISEWSAKKDDEELSRRPSIGSATPPDLESMLNLIDAERVMNYGPENSSNPGRTLLPLHAYLQVMPPPGLSPLSAGEKSCVQSSLEAQSASELCTSLGSFGHPYRCAAACRYIKRKGGCKNGASCPECHLCFWQRKPSSQQVEFSQAPQFFAASDSAETCPEGKVDDITRGADFYDSPSLGSVNHPHGCATACRYIYRKGGCRLGKSCLDCHLCHWRRERRPAVAEPRAMPLKVGLVEQCSVPTAQDRLEWLIKLQLDSASEHTST